MFGLGEEIMVSVVKVNLDDCKIDFELLVGGKKVCWSKDKDGISLSGKKFGLWRNKDKQ